MSHIITHLVFQTAEKMRQTHDNMTEMLKC